MLKGVFWLIVLLALVGVWKPVIAIVLAVILVGAVLKCLR
jgi:hypothetical protein